MQSQPTEIQPNEPDSLTFQPVSSAQYGLRNDLELSSSSSPPRDAIENAAQQCSDGDTSSVSSGISVRGRKPNVRWLRSHDGSSHGGSPGNRIDQYERSHTSSQKDERVSFQVIPSVKGANGYISVEQFPNGKLLVAKAKYDSHCLQRSLHISYRTCLHQPYLP
jgi:hypothetical protein